MTLTYISCSSDFYTFYVNVPLSLGCMIRKVSAEDIAIRGNGTGLEYMCPTRHFVYIFFNPVFQVSTAKNEINLFNNHILILAPVTFAPAGAMTPSAEFLFYIIKTFLFGCPFFQLCQERHVSLSGKRMCTNTQQLRRPKPAQENFGQVNCLIQHDLNIVDWAIKLQTNQANQLFGCTTLRVHLISGL